MIDRFPIPWPQCLLLLIAAATLTVFYPAQGMQGAAPPAAASKPEAGPAWHLSSLLQQSWQFYKGRFLVDGAHVVSNTYGGTISEGQSYALLKALWMNEPATFQKIWQWTRLNLKRPHDHLLGWRWGDGEFGTSKGLMELDNAADADQDIAYALLLAGRQWNRPDYTRDGLNIVKDLWRLNVQLLDGRYYLIPGTWEGFKEEYLTLDPSYLAPYVYREFARADVANAAGWTQLADDSYDVLEACTNLTRPKLPPNWCAVKWQEDHQGSRIIFSDRQGDGSRDFSYDAFRVYWRMAMDARLSPVPGRDRAKAYLKNHPFLLDYWRQHATMPEGFTAQGLPRTQETSGFAMGPVLVLNHFQQPAQDGALYQQLLAPHYHAEGYWFNDYNDFLHSVIWLHLYALSLKPA
ncbi:glycosyl hydrolase family 8 [Vampirovibrio sp.]|uniref:glycosyl hydrolase family 8 n=1 Tax=Vampirovibrio sp. TaxID=2717857 RepID=UPI0035944C46